MTAQAVPADHGRGGPPADGGGPHPRCAWCGRFVARATPLVAWRVQVAPESQQVPDDEWNYWAKRLCPPHAESVHTLWWEAVTLEEAYAARGDLAFNGRAIRAAL